MPYVYIELDGTSNNTPLGKLVNLNELIDFVASIKLVWYKFTGLPADGAIPNQPLNPVLWLDLSVGSAGFASPKFVNTNGLSSKLIPLPVDFNLSTGVMQTYPLTNTPIVVSTADGGQRTLRDLAIRVLDGTGNPAAFTRAFMLLEVEQGARGLAKVSLL